MVPHLRLNAARAGNFVALRRMALGLSLLCGGCSAEDADLSRFLGDFQYDEGMLTARCDGVSASFDPTDIEVSIARRSSESLEFMAGPRCQFALDVQGNVASAAPGTACSLAVRQTSAEATFAEFRLTATDSGLTETGAGRATLAVPTAGVIECEEFTLSGALVRSAAP